MAGTHRANEDAARVTSVPSPMHDHAVVNEGADIDETTLGALGYKQEFKRDFSILESFSVSFSILCILPSVASTLSYSFGYSGLGGSVWGWLAASIMIQSTAFSMAELCSSMPTAGGLYYAAAVLAPDGYGPFFSWIVGWANFCGFVLSPLSINYVLALLLVTCGSITNPEYTPKDWHVYLLLLLLLIIDGLLAMQSTRITGYIGVAGTAINVIVVVIFVIWMPVGSINHPKTNDSHTVWTSFENGTQWPIGWSTIMGFLTAIFTMAGFDAPFHLTEECSNSNIASPRAIVLTAQTGFYVGWMVILVIAYTVKSVPDILAGQYQQPFGSLCLQVLGERSGLAMIALTIVAQFFAGHGCTITASRIVFAFSRDGALPGSRWWRQVNSRTSTPVKSTWFVLTICALFGLLIFAGPLAIGAVFNIGAIGQYTAFTMPIALKLFAGSERFKPGPWNLGKFSKPVNIAACAWWLLIAPALCFPAMKGASLTPQNMNWTIAIYGGAMFLALVYYAVSGRKWFEGPRVNIEHVRDAPAGEQKFRVA